MVSVSLATLEILSPIVSSRPLSHLVQQRSLIPAILLLVDQMQCVRIETEQQPVSVSLNILEILMLPAGLNV